KYARLIASAAFGQYGLLPIFWACSGGKSCANARTRPTHAASAPACSRRQNSLLLRAAKVRTSTRAPAMKNPWTLELAHRPIRTPLKIGLGYRLVIAAAARKSSKEV